MKNVKRAETVIVGAGLVGLMAAHELSRAGEQSILLVAPEAPAQDTRTTAMLMPSIARLEAYGVWSEAKKQTTPLRTMRLIDGTKRLLRASPISFEAVELGVEAFGYNVPNATMMELLAEHFPASVSRINASVISLEVEGGRPRLLLSDGSFVDADVAVAADGRNSLLREAAGISTRQWRYPQVALVTTFAHTLPHNDVSTEFHTETGPFTQVPLPPKPGAKHRSSLVWVVRPEQADTILEQPIENTALQIERKMQSMLGHVTLEAGLQSFALNGQTATTFAANGVALVGEAAHVFPPIGAQGFNLGVRDVVALAKALSENHSDPLQQYARTRLLDVNSRTLGVDLLNRSLLTGFLPVQAARAVGFATLNSWAWLRKRIMQQGMGVIPEKGPAAADPR